MFLYVDPELNKLYYKVYHMWPSPWGSFFDCEEKFFITADSSRKICHPDNNHDYDGLTEENRREYLEIKDDKLTYIKRSALPENDPAEKTDA